MKKTAIITLIEDVVLQSGDKHATMPLRDQKHFLPKTWFFHGTKSQITSTRVNLSVQCSNMITVQFFLATDYHGVIIYSYTFERIGSKHYVHYIDPDDGESHKDLYYGFCEQKPEKWAYVKTVYPN